MIEGERVRLRAVERVDLPRFVRWINDDEVTDHPILEGPMSMEQKEGWYRTLLDSETRVFSIESLEGELIGNIGLLSIDWINRKVLIGIMIGEKDYWGRGYGTDAIRLTLRYMFDELNMTRVELDVDSMNSRAIRCYERCGFRREGLNRKHRFKRGEYRDNIYMAISREDWDGGN